MNEEELKELFGKNYTGSYFQYGNGKYMPSSILVETLKASLPSYYKKYGLNPTDNIQGKEGSEALSVLMNGALENIFNYINNGLLRYENGRFYTTDNLKSKKEGEGDNERITFYYTGKDENGNDKNYDVEDISWQKQEFEGKGKKQTLKFNAMNHALNMLNLYAPQIIKNWESDLNAYQEKKKKENDEREAAAAAKIVKFDFTKHSPMVGYIPYINPTYSLNSTSKEIMSLINNLINTEKKNDNGSYQYGVRFNDLYNYLNSYYKKIEESENLDFSNTLYDKDSYLKLVSELRNVLGTSVKDESGNTTLTINENPSDDQIAKLKVKMNKLGFHNDFVNYFTSSTLLDLNTGTSTPLVPPTQVTDSGAVAAGGTSGAVAAGEGTENNDENSDITERDNLKKGGKILKGEEGLEITLEPKKRRPMPFYNENIVGSTFDDALRYYDIPGIGEDRKGLNTFFRDPEKFVKDNNLKPGEYSQYASLLLNRMFVSNPNLFEPILKTKDKDGKEKEINGYYRLKGSTIVYKQNPNAKIPSVDNSLTDGALTLGNYFMSYRRLNKDDYDDIGDVDYEKMISPPSAKRLNAGNLRYSNLSGEPSGGNENLAFFTPVEKARIGVAIADAILAFDPELWSSLFGGIGTAATTYILDKKEGYSTGRALANLGANLGLTALGLIPYAGGLPTGAIKSGKVLVKYAPKIYAALRAANLGAVAVGAAVELPQMYASLEKAIKGDKLTSEDYRNIINGTSLLFGISGASIKGKTKSSRAKITEKAIAANDQAASNQYTIKKQNEIKLSVDSAEDAVEDGLRAYVVASKEPDIKTNNVKEEYKVLQFKDEETSKAILDAAYKDEVNANQPAKAVDEVLKNIPGAEGYHVLRNDDKITVTNKDANLFQKFFRTKEFKHKEVDPSFSKGAVGIVAKDNAIENNLSGPYKKWIGLFRKEIQSMNVEPIKSNSNLPNKGRTSNYVLIEGKYTKPKSKTENASGAAKTEGANVKAAELSKKTNDDLIKAANKHSTDNKEALDNFRYEQDASKLPPHSDEYNELEKRAKEAGKGIIEFIKEINKEYVPVWKRGSSVTRLVQKAQGGTEFYGDKDDSELVKYLKGITGYEYSENGNEKIQLKGWEGQPNDLRPVHFGSGIENFTFDPNDIQLNTNNARPYVFNDENVKTNMDNAVEAFTKENEKGGINDFLKWYNNIVMELYKYKRDLDNPLARQYSNEDNAATENFNKLYNLIYSASNGENYYKYDEALQGRNGSTTATRAIDILKDENGNNKTRTMEITLGGKKFNVVNNGQGFLYIMQNTESDAQQVEDQNSPGAPGASGAPETKEEKEDDGTESNKGGVDGNQTTTELPQLPGNDLGIESIDVPQDRTRNSARQFDLDLYSPAKLFGNLRNNWLQYKGTLADVYGRDNPIEFLKYYTGDEGAVQQGYQELGNYTSAAMRYRTADSTANYLNYLTSLSSGLNSVRNGYRTDSKAKKTSAADVLSQMKENQQSRYDIAKSNATADMNMQSKNIHAKNTLRASNWTSINNFLSEMQQNYLTEKSKRDELTETALKEDIYNTMYADLRKYLGPLYQEGDQEFMDKINAGIIDTDNWDVDSDEYKRYVRITSALSRKYNSEYLKRKGIRINTYEPDVSVESGSGGPTSNVNGAIFDRRGGRIAFGRSGGRTVNTTEKIEIQKLRTKVENMKALQKDALKQADMLMKQIDSVNKRIKKNK